MIPLTPKPPPLPDLHSQQPNKKWEEKQKKKKRVRREFLTAIIAMGNKITSAYCT